MHTDLPSGTFTPTLNLLPSRRLCRQAHRRRFASLALCCLLAFVATMLIARHFVASEIVQQTRHVQQLEQQIAQLRAHQRLELGQGKTLSTTDIQWLEQWLHRSSLRAPLLKQLGQLTPDSVALTQYQLQGIYSTISGHALSPPTLKQFETALSQAPQWGRITQREATAAWFRQRPVHTFSLQIAHQEQTTP
jgi:Tfp pilus assembly protein PilN